MQLCKEPKNGFLMAKQGLRLHGNLKTNLVSNWRGPVEKKEKEKRRGRGREDGGAKQSSTKVWMLAFGMELVIFIWNYMVCMEFLSNCMVRRLLQT